LRSSHSPWPRLLKAGGSRTKQTDCLSARSCWVAPQCSPQTTRGAASGLLATLFSRGAARLLRLVGERPEPQEPGCTSWMSWERSRPSGAAGFKRTRRWSRLIPASIGGLSYWIVLRRISNDHIVIMKRRPPNVHVGKVLKGFNRVFFSSPHRGRSASLSLG
jgi:hypothetical protein